MSKKLILICAAFLLVVAAVAAPGYIRMFRQRPPKETDSEKALKIAEKNDDTVILDFRAANGNLSTSKMITEMTRITELFRAGTLRRCSTEIPGRSCLMCATGANMTKVILKIRF